MVLVSYAICVCNEHLELDNLLNFLDETRHVDSETVVLVDSEKAPPEVYEVLKKYQWVSYHERKFTNDFAAHKNHLNSLCRGEYIFNIDADEIPQETLMHAVAQCAKSNEYDIVYVPRINVCPGYTTKFIDKHNFKVNEIGWINWPDYQARIYRRRTTKWTGVVHERVEGPTQRGLPPEPQYALWHIKSVAKQDKQNTLYSQISNNGEGTRSED